MCISSDHGLTDGLVRDERLVVEAEDLSDVVEARVLRHERPLREVHPVVEVGYGNLHAPVVLVVDLNVPVDAYRAHVVRALEEGGVVLLRRVDPHHFQLVRIRPAALVKNMSED